LRRAGTIKGIQHTQKQLKNITTKAGVIPISIMTKKFTIERLKGDVQV
jgi:molecular chaperone GrpE (heat shock protein)